MSGQESWRRRRYGNNLRSVALRSEAETGAEPSLSHSPGLGGGGGGGGTRASEGRVDREPKQVKTGGSATVVSDVMEELVSRRLLA